MSALLVRLRRATFTASVFGLSVSGTFAQDAAPTFHKDIVPLLQKHCLSCHHKGGSAPQSMESYKEMKPWIRSSKKEANNKTMPPWHADPAVGKWKNDSRMTDAEIKIIADWADAKGPEGDAKDAPAPIDFSKEWKLGTPDLILTMPAEAEVPASGDAYKSVALAHDFAQDTWVSGIEFSPGNPDVVQQIAVSAVPAALAKSVEPAGFDAPKGDGVKPYLASRDKGMSLTEKFPEGTGVLIPKGSALVLHVHYKSAGEAAKDQSKVGLYLAKSPAAKELKTAAVENRAIEIPANAIGHKLTAELKLDKAAKIHAILPQMHYLGRKIEVSANGSPILKIDDYIYDFQTIYTASEPVKLAAGTKLIATGVYDNSKDNPNNPNMAVKAASYGPAPEGEKLSVIIYYTEE